MIAFDFILTLTASFGLANAVCREFVFEWLRDIVTEGAASKLVRCETCCGFWCGAAISFLLLSNDKLDATELSVYVLCFALSASSFCKFCAALVNKIMYD